jgi:hypothetical protein
MSKLVDANQISAKEISVTRNVKSKELERYTGTLYTLVLEGHIKILGNNVSFLQH